MLVCLQEHSQMQGLNLGIHIIQSGFKNQSREEIERVN